MQQKAHTRIRVLKPARRDLLTNIRRLEREINAHQASCDHLQEDERFDAANEEKTEADGKAEKLIELLMRAQEEKMDTEDFPAVQALIQKYITVKEERLKMSAGSAAH